MRVGECEGVLEEGEGWMTECGPIGADLDRLVEQQEILDVSIYMYMHVHVSVILAAEPVFPVVLNRNTFCRLWMRSY